MNVLTSSSLDTRITTWAADTEAQRPRGGTSAVRVKDLDCGAFASSVKEVAMAYLRIETNWSRTFQLSAALSGLILIGLVDPGQAFPQTAKPRRLGKIEVLSGPVQCADGDCYDIRVTCPEVAAPARARLKVVAPGSTSPRGTILFTTGLFGFTLYESAGESRRTLTDLAAAGFRTVQLQWIDTWLFGSPGKEEGHARLGCRPATVARWVYDHLHQPSSSTPFCATGNSGGASQVSYMLSHYGLEEILSAVVPTGGPPMGRIDRLCSPDDPAYLSDEGMRKLIDGGFGFVPPGDPRTIKPADVPAIDPAVAVTPRTGRNYARRALPPVRGTTFIRERWSGLSLKALRILPPYKEPRITNC